MAVLRQSVLLNMDAGLWFGLSSGRGAGVPLSVEAERYADLSTFVSQLTAVNWNTNQWGDQTKRLIDIEKGYRIRESIFTQGPVPATPINSSSLSPAPAAIGDEADRSNVLYSLAYAKYLYRNPATANLPAAQQQFSWVSNHTEATRFDNLIPVADFLTNSMLGDDPKGYEIQNYYFTKKQVITSYSYFGGAPTTANQIERAFVPYSKEFGKYVWIDPATYGSANPTVVYTTSPWEASRFQNANDFYNIVNASFLSGTAYGFELPQFYFNRAALPPAGNPFDIFWCDENNGPFNCIGDKMPTCDWICRQASIYSSEFAEFLRSVSNFLLEAECYPDSKAFNIWWSQQDYGAFEQWMYEFWIRCGGKG